MTGSTSPTPDEGPSRAEWRRLRQRHIEARQRWLDERDAVLESSLESGERIVVRSRAHPIVTDRRILQVRPLHTSPRRDRWVVDPLSFEEITSWSSGERHDHRPILKLEHRPLTRIDRVPARRFLWFTWGNAEGHVTQTTTSFGFGRHTNPVLLAMRAELERRSIPQASSFVIRPAGTRANRTKGSTGTLLRYTRTGRIRWLSFRATTSLYRNLISAPVRILSWLLLGVPAWFVSPWLVVPAVIVAELAWIAIGQWMWRRNTSRANITGLRR